VSNAKIMKNVSFVSLPAAEKCEKTTISENIAEKGNLVIYMTCGYIFIAQFKLSATDAVVYKSFNNIYCDTIL